MQLTSSAFSEGGSIPSLYTCEGKSINPPLMISHVPKEAICLVLLMDDPDVPASVRKEQMWDHWVVFNIPPSTTKIQENSPPPGVQGEIQVAKINTKVHVLPIVSIATFLSYML